MICDETVTQKPPNVSKLDCTFTGPNLSSNVPSDMRTNTVEATEVIPAFAMIVLHPVPLPQTHFGSVETSYLLALANVHSSLDASSSHAGILASSSGMSLQSDLSSVAPLGSADGG